MTAILKKELSSYFTSAIGYVIMAVYYAFAGFFFWLSCITVNSKDMGNVFSSMFSITILIIPIITMKSFAEEKKQKTDQALLTSPLGLVEIVAGKFLGSLIMFLCCVGIYVVFALTLTFYSAPDWSVLLGNLLGKTDGSFSVSSKFGTKSTVSFLISLNNSSDILESLDSV